MVQPTTLSNPPTWLAQLSAAPNSPKVKLAAHDVFTPNLKWMREQLTTQKKNAASSVTPLSDGRRGERGAAAGPATVAGWHLPRSRLREPTALKHSSRKWNFINIFYYWNKCAADSEIWIVMLGELSAWSLNLQLPSLARERTSTVTVRSVQWEWSCFCKRRLPAPVWRLTSTFLMTWRTSGRRTSTRYVDLLYYLYLEERTPPRPPAQFEKQLLL